MRTIYIGCAAILSVACSGPSTPSPVGTLTQAIRAGAGDEGKVYLGADLLVTETSGEAVPCGVGNVSFSVEVSRNGTAGPYERVDSARVYRACSSANQGQLALVIDNSESVKDEIDLIKSAALRVSDSVIDRGGQVSLTRVSTNSRVLSPISSDPEALRGAIDQMGVNQGWTALYDGVRMAGETLGLAEQKAKVGRVDNFDSAGSFCDLGSSRSIVLFTDSGENNSSGQKLENADYPGDGIDTKLGDLLQLSVGATTTPIYTVGLGPDADVGPLNALAKATGGRHVALDDPNGIEDVLGMLAEYNASTHRVCTQLPDHVCGSLDVRIGHRFDLGGQVSAGSTVQHIELPCPARAQGRVATLLLTLDATSMAKDTTHRLVAQTVNWTSPVDAPRVLFVRDDFHHDEFSDDTGKLYETLLASGYATTLMDEPESGIRFSDLDGFDVVWFSNPGYPMDDISTLQALTQFSEAGGGVVLQGDDMSWSWGNAFSLEPLTQLKHQDNGTEYCGESIDNGSGTYQVTFADSTHPILSGLAGETFTYGDDIDTVTANRVGTEVLATATVVTGKKKNCKDKPVIVAYTPK